MPTQSMASKADAPKMGKSLRFFRGGLGGSGGVALVWTQRLGLGDSSGRDGCDFALTKSGDWNRRRRIVYVVFLVGCFGYERLLCVLLVERSEGVLHRRPHRLGIGEAIHRLVGKRAIDYTGDFGMHCRHHLRELFCGFGHREQGHFVLRLGLVHVATGEQPKHHRPWPTSRFARRCARIARGLARVACTPACPSPRRFTSWLRQCRGRARPRSRAPPRRHRTRKCLSGLRIAVNDVLRVGGREARRMPW